MFDFEELDKKEVKAVIRELAIEYNYKHGNDSVKYKNIDDRVAIKLIPNIKLRKALYYVKEAKFKVYYGDCGKNCYNVYIKKDLLNLIFEAFNLDKDLLEDTNPRNK